MCFLTGENGKSGGTEIRSGTLQIGNGGTAGSIQGDVANDGVLVFHRSDDIAFAGAIGGNGNIRPLGGGRTSVVSGKRVAVRVDLGGRRLIKTKKRTQISE